MRRREFVKLSAALAAASQLPLACSTKKNIPVTIVGDAANIGHLLRDGKFHDTPTARINTPVVIVGAGVAGLSAAYHLLQQKTEDFILLDLEDHTGGNAAYGQNNISAYPWGAHYIPIPNNDLPEYHAFLQQAGVITQRTDDGLPVYNDTHLCFDPQERLYINGRWQEGLVPTFGVPDEQASQIQRFLHLMDEWREAKGSDGKYAFAIPIDNSSTDSQFVLLDTMTMKQWLEQNGFNSTYLHEYIEYCCRDDYGTSYATASAWTGIHYFAARKGKGKNANHSDVLTWPEGNGFLANELKKGLDQRIQLQSLVISVKSTANGVSVHYIDVKSQQVKAIDAQQCILAVPQFVAARLLQDDERAKKVTTHFHYVPWVVANLEVSKLEERSGAAASWDNVIHGGRSLGYVEATHELLNQYQSTRNLTWYWPLTDKEPLEARRWAQQQTADDWREIIISDLEKVHPNIREVTKQIKVMLWGHAMAQPVPGMIWQAWRKELGESIEDRIHFAHSDLAGISIFEEAFYRGLGAAKKVMQYLHT